MHYTATVFKVRRVKKLEIRTDVGIELMFLSLGLLSRQEYCLSCLTLRVMGSIREDALETSVLYKSQLLVVQNESDLLENKPVVYCSKFTLCQQWHRTQSKKSVQGILCKVWELRRADSGLVTQAFQPHLLHRPSRILLWRLQKAGLFSPLEIHLHRLRTWPPKKNWVSLTI